MFMTSKHQKQPILVLYFLFAWYIASPILKNTQLTSNLDLSQFMGGIIILFLSFQLLWIPFHKIPQRLLFAIYLFLVFIFLNVFTGEKVSHSFLIFFRIWGSFCILIYFFCNCDAKIAEKINLLVIIIAFSTAVYTIIQFVIFKIDVQSAFGLFGENAFLISYSTVRPRGLINSAGGSASLMSLGLIFIYYQSLTGKFLTWYKPVLIIIIIGLLLNFTRTFVFSLIFFFMLTFYFYGQYKQHIKTIIIVISVLLSIVYFTGLDRFSDRFIDIPIFSNIGSDEAYMGRKLLTRIPLNELKKQPPANIIFGNGLSWTESKIKAYFIRIFPNRSVETSTHNDFVWLLCNAGILGLFFYLLFIWMIIETYKFKMKIFYVMFFLIFLVFSGLGGETINISGHRYLQFLCLAYLFNDGKLNPKSWAKPDND